MKNKLDEVKKRMDEVAIESILRIAREYKFELDTKEKRLLLIDVYRQGAIDALEEVRRK